MTAVSVETVIMNKERIIREFAGQNRSRYASHSTPRRAETSAKKIGVPDAARLAL